MKKIYLFALLTLAFGAAVAQSIFTNAITDPNPSTANPFTAGQVVDPNITVSGIGRGTGTVAVATSNAYNANGWNSVALDVNDYYEFTLTPSGANAINFISFVYTGAASGTGAVNFAFRSSIDAFTANIGTPTATGTTISLSAPAYQSITTATTFRLYGWGGSAAGGTFRINDFTFNGVTGVLPITIEYLNGVKQNSTNVLSWKVNCTSSATAILSIERGNDGRNYNTVNTITATALRCLQPFDFTDNNPLAGYNYYRLKMTDEDGRITYSNKIALLNKDKGFDIVNLVPTIIRNTAILNVTAAQKTQMTLVITDFAGRQVQNKVYNLIAGSNQMKINVANFSAGAYVIAAYTTQDETKTVRFLKQ
ncbi:T9SS type A sorting domain-containing protein [Ferruginibacter sp.]